MPSNLHDESDINSTIGSCRDKGITVVVPCFEEPREIIERTVSGIRDALEKLPAFDFEIIVVDDGTEGVDYGAALKTTGVKHVRHHVNRGYGASLATGIRHARFEWIGIIDADGTYPYDHFPSLIDETQDYEMVIGARNWGEIDILRRPAKMILTLLASFLANYRIPDLNSGMRVFHRRIYEENWRLFPHRFSFSSTLTMAALTYLHDVRFVPIPYRKRVGKSFINPVRDTVRFFYQLMRLSLYFRPLRIFMPISAILGILATARGIRDYLLVGSLGGLTLILYFMAFQVFFFGLIAEIINKK